MQSLGCKAKAELSQAMFAELQKKLHSLKHEKHQKLNDHLRHAVQEGDDRETDTITVTLKLLQDNEIDTYLLEADWEDFINILTEPNGEDLPLHISILNPPINKLPSQPR